MRRRKGKLPGEGDKEEFLIRAFETFRCPFAGEIVSNAEMLTERRFEWESDLQKMFSVGIDQVGIR